MKKGFFQTITGGIFHGSDGQFSGRRLFGTGFLIAGTVMAWNLQAMHDLTWVNLVPMGVVFLVGLILWGLVTIQNIKDIASKVKGEKDGQ